MKKNIEDSVLDAVIYATTFVLALAAAFLIF